MTEQQTFRFSHSTEWGKDLEIMRRDGPIRWSAPQLDVLKQVLCGNGLAIVGDAIGSLQFDLAERLAEMEKVLGDAYVLIEGVRLGTDWEMSPTIREMMAQWSKQAERALTPPAKET